MNEVEDLKKKFILIRELKIKLARINFWEYCKLLHPDFYKDSRQHLKIICDTLQGIRERTIINSETNEPYTRLILNIPPRHGKSRTLFLFVSWCLGVDIDTKCLSISYNDSIASDFSRYTRDVIGEEKILNHNIVYSDIFPKTKLKHGDSSVQKWAIEGKFFSFLGSGFFGQYTGRGANIICIDDPVKNSYEAFNSKNLIDIQKMYSGSIISRKENNTIEIICMTRWASEDLCGYVLSGDYGNSWKVLNMPVIDGEGNLLCSEIFDKASFDYAQSTIDPVIFRANYFNELIDMKNSLYSMQYYERLPEKFEKIIATIDTADKGKDYLCLIVAGLLSGQLYIIDVLYTQEDMGITENKVSEMLYKSKVNECDIESNAGGENFARHIKNILIEKYNCHSIKIKTFQQTKNKEARILDTSSWINQNVFFSESLYKNHSSFYNAIFGYSRLSKNINDDAPDALTMLAEKVIKKKTFTTWSF